MFSFIVLSGILIFLIRSWYKEHYRYWIKRGFASDGPCFPLDSLTGTGTNVHNSETFDKLYHRFKGQPVVGLFFVFTPAIAVYDPKLIQSILVRDFTHFHDRYLYYNEKEDPLSAHMLAIEGQIWKERRTKLTPVFTSGKMKMMFETINTIGDTFVLSIMKDLKFINNLEISEWLNRYTTDVIGNIAFGLDCNCIENPETDFRKYGKKLLRVDTPFTAVKWLFVNSFQTFSRRMGLMLNPKDASDFFMNIFRKTIQYREEANVERKDFVHLLLQMKRNGTLGFNEIAAESFIFYIGGFHTSASLMNFILYELALNQEIQTRLRNEITEKLNKSNGNLSYDLLFEMKYLEMVVNEGLRKYPPINVVTRKCTKDYMIPGSNLVIRKGTQCTIPVYSIHRDPDYYPEPCKFDPERFNAENVRNRKPFTFLPFGEGPRICIGIRFAFMTTKLALVKLINEFRFDKCDKTLIPMKYSVKSLVLSPENEELFLRVTKRQLYLPKQLLIFAAIITLNNAQIQPKLQSSGFVLSQPNQVQYSEPDSLPAAAVNYHSQVQTYQYEDQEENVPQPRPQPTQQQPIRRQQQPYIRNQNQKIPNQKQILEELEEEEPDRLAILLEKSNFKCDGRTGYYADEEVGCEVFHYCQENQKHSWICPEGFTFHQVHLICMPPSGESICAQSSKYHVVNDYLYKPVNLDEHETKPNVTLRYSERYYPENFYQDDRQDQDYRSERQRQSVQVANRKPQPAPTQSYRQPYQQATQTNVYRSPDAINIPLQQRRPQIVFSPTTAQYEDEEYNYQK